MLKITVEIKEDLKNPESSKVTIKPQKDTSKCSDSEKSTGAMVYNAICKAIENLQK